MTNYDQMKNLLRQFSDKYVGESFIESKMSDVSEDKNESVISGSKKRRNSVLEMEIVS